MAGFQTTQWSLVVAAGDDNTSVAHGALASLYQTYWYPLYAYVRRRGRPADDARDVVQAFFVSLLERRDFSRLTREQGRFRAFLLASLKHFLANDFARRQTLKRGGGMDMLSLDGAEERYAREPTDPMTPEMLYERRWALTGDRPGPDGRAEEWREQGREHVFDALRDCLLGTRPPGGYAEAAAHSRCRKAPSRRRSIGCGAAFKPNSYRRSPRRFPSLARPTTRFGG